jgi:hypothetical protein
MYLDINSKYNQIISELRYVDGEILTTQSVITSTGLEKLSQELGVPIADH